VGTTHTSHSSDTPFWEALNNSDNRLSSMANAGIGDMGSTSESHEEDEEERESAGVVHSDANGEAEIVWRMAVGRRVGNGLVLREVEAGSDVSCRVTEVNEILLPCFLPRTDFFERIRAS